MRQLRRFAFILIVSALLVCWANASPGPQAEQKPLSALPGNPAVPRLLLNHVTVQLKDGGVFSGYLLGVGDGTLLIKRNGKDEAVPSSQMARVFIEKNSDRNTFAGIGLFMGPYLINLTGAKAQNQPFAFIRKQYGLSAFSLLLWASAGAALGYYAGPIFEAKQVEFDFSGDERQRLAGWEDLRKFVLGVPRPAKIHLELQAGVVNPRVSNLYAPIFENAGYTIGPYPISADWAEPASNVNLLRRLQVTYSIRPQIEAGLAVYFLGEPRQDAYNYTTYTTSSIYESLSGTGYFGIICYHPLQRKLPTWLSWDVGLGLGAAKVDFKLDTYRQIYMNSPPYTMEAIQHSQRINKTLFGGVVFTELDVFLGRSISLGISADYVLLPSNGASAVADFGISAQKIRFGNSSVGLTLGLHY